MDDSKPNKRRKRKLSIGQYQRRDKKQKTDQSNKNKSVSKYNNKKLTMIMRKERTMFIPTPKTCLNKEENGETIELVAEDLPINIDLSNRNFFGKRHHQYRNMAIAFTYKNEFCSPPPRLV